LHAVAYCVIPSDEKFRFSGTMVREIVRTWCMKDSKVGPQQAKQRAEIAHLFEMCRGYDVMAVKSVLVKVSTIQSTSKNLVAFVWEWFWMFYMSHCWLEW
jgi:hypothetical protein